MNEKLQQELEAELAKLDKESSKDSSKEDVSKTETTELDTKSDTESDSVDDTSTDQDSSESEHTKSSETKYTEIELQAIEQGWNPDHKGPNKKTAEQFIRDGSFFKKIDEQKKEISELKSMVKQQLDHNRKVEQAAYEKALKDLQIAKYQAIQEGDVDTYNKVENQTKIVEQQLEQVKPAEPTPPGRSPELQAFLDNNKSWFNLETPENRRMAAMANSVFQIELEEANRTGRQINEAELLKKVEAEIKDTFKHRFENANQKKPSLVTKGTVGSGQATKESISGLTKQQQEFIRKAKQIDPSFTADKYIKQLKLTGDYHE